MMSAPSLFALSAAAGGTFPPPRREIETGRGLADALILEGVLTGRLELPHDRIRVLGRGGTSDSALDGALERIGSAGRRQAEPMA